MKKLIVVMTAVMFSVAAHAQTIKEQIKVSGNCGMCAGKIEKAAKEAGAKKASWDKETKVLSVTYNAAKTSNDAIQKKVADAGYDTEKYTADMEVYNKLHNCCQYENKRK